MFDKHALSLVGYDEYMREKGDVEWIEEVNYSVTREGRVSEGDRAESRDWTRKTSSVEPTRMELGTKREKAGLKTRPRPSIRELVALYSEQMKRSIGSI